MISTKTLIENCYLYFLKFGWLQIKLKRRTDKFSCWNWNKACNISWLNLQKNFSFAEMMWGRPGGNLDGCLGGSLGVGPGHSTSYWIQDGHFVTKIVFFQKCLKWLLVTPLMSFDDNYNNSVTYCCLCLPTVYFLLILIKICLDIGEKFGFVPGDITKHTRAHNCTMIELFL